MRDYIDAIYDRINELLAGKLSMLTFRQTFDFLYLENISSEVLSDEEFYFFSKIDSIFKNSDREAIEIIQRLKVEQNHN
jgi:hypothetical protein